MGQEFLTSVKTLLKEDEEDQRLQEHFRRNEARIKNDFKGKILML